MIAIITKAAMVPPKLIPGVSMKPGVYSGSSASRPKPMTPKIHFCGRARPAHQCRNPSPGARSRPAGVAPFGVFGSAW